MCNLSQKEGSSLFAVLPERGRHCQRTFLFTQRRFFFLGGGWICRLESNHIGLTRSLLTGEKTHSPAGGGGHVIAGTSLAFHLGDTAWGSECHMGNPPPVVNALCYCHPEVSLEVLPTGCCLACFSFIQGQDEFYIPIRLKEKCRFTVLTGLNATRLAEERQTLNKGRRTLGV